VSRGIRRVSRANLDQALV